MFILCASVLSLLCSVTSSTFMLLTRSMPAGVAATGCRLLPCLLIIIADVLLGFKRRCCWTPSAKRCRVLPGYCCRCVRLRADTYPLHIWSDRSEHGADVSQRRWWWTPPVQSQSPVRSSICCCMQTVRYLISWCAAVFENGLWSSCIYCPVCLVFVNLSASVACRSVSNAFEKSIETTVTNALGCK